MRMQPVFVALVCFSIGVCLTAKAQAQFPTPEVTKEHKFLKKDVGVWDAEMKIWAAGPGSEPLVSKGVETNRMMGDLWMITEYQADLGGQKLTGHGQMGYDPIKKKFVGTWIDSMTPHLSTYEGKLNEKTGELVATMKSTDPATGDEVPGKSVTKHIDDRTRVFSIYMKSPEGGDKWVKSMEINYTRRAD